MKRKIVYGSFEHESNSLTAVPTIRKDFSISIGCDNGRRPTAENYMKENGCEVIHTLHATAVPSGKVLRADFDSMLNDILTRIPDGDIDGVLFRLHGAMDVEGIGSGDLAVAKAIREKIGPDRPLALSFDLHADVDPEIAKYANIICGYRTAPHIDIEDTHLRAAKLLIECIDRKYLPKPLIVKVPIIADGDSMTTDVYPGNEIIKTLFELESRNKMLSLNIFLGNPWVDAACAGGAVVAIPEIGHEDEAAKAALELAAMFWSVRDKFKFRAPTAYLEEGIDWALSKTDKPVFLSDSGDNVTGGGSGDNAEVLGAFLKRGASGVLIAGIADAGVVEACRNLKPGDKFRCKIGGTLDPKSKSLEAEAVFKHNGAVYNWPGSVPIESVLISIDGVDVIVNKDRTPIVYASTFTGFGIDVEKYRIVVVKLGYLWPELCEISKDFLMLLTNGSTCEVMADCDFHIVPRPIYPLDKDMVWTPKIAEV